MTTEITLRPYQLEAIGRVEAAAARGVLRQLGVASVGMGKTIIFCSLARQMNVQTLILAHRDELISQAVEKLLLVWPDVDVGVVKAERNEWGHQVVVASVQSLRSSRLKAIPTDRFGLIITDECHHSAAPSYRIIYDHFRCGSEGGPLSLGVTATPGRGDGQGLDSAYDEIVFNYDLLWGIRAGYLSDMRGLRIHIKDLDTKSIKVSKGDYEAGAAGQALQDANAPEQIVEAWLRYGEDRKTIAFLPTVASAQSVADEFAKAGVSVGAVFGETPLEDRRLILKRFANDEIKVLVNVLVASEGYDEPSVSCILMARPTKSRSLYLQMVGRASRRHPDKVDALIMDVVGASALNLVTVPSLFGIEKEDGFEGGEITVAEAMFAQEEAAVLQGKLAAQAIELFRKVLESPINWVHFDDPNGLKSYSVSLGRELGTVMIERVGGDSENWHTFLKWDKDHRPTDHTNLREFTNGDCYRTLVTDVDLELAQGVGEDFVRKTSEDNRAVTILTDRNAKWRQNRPTDKQVEAAGKWGMRVNRDWTAGELSDALSAHIEAKKARGRNRRTPTWVKDKMDRERGGGR